MRKKFSASDQLKINRATLKDSLAFKKLKKKMRDSVSHLVKGKVLLADSAIRKKANSLLAGKNGLIKNTNKQINEAQKKIDEQIAKVSNPKISFNYSFDNQFRYQPVAVPGDQRFINNFNLLSGLQIFGIPLGFNYTENHADLPGTNSFNNNLFKLNFNKNQFSEMVKADLQKYSSFKDQFFSGMDLSDYLKEKVFNNVTTATVSAGSGPSQLRNLMNDPAGLRNLLVLDQNQLRSKLTDILNQSIPDSLKAGVNTSKAINTGKDKPLSQVPFPTQARKDSVMVTDTVKSALAIAQHINSVSDLKSSGLNELQKQVIDDSLKATADTVKMVANLFQSVSKAGSSKDLKLLAMQQANAFKADSTAREITKIKLQLQQNGLDVNRVLTMEKYLSDGDLSPASINEIIRNNHNSKFQPFLSHLNDFRVGNYSLQIPGGVQNSDLFINGGHIDFKLGYRPFSAGYGTLNDLNSLKDASYQTSVYSNPKNITYLSALISNDYSGKLKFSVVSAFGNQFSALKYSNPSLPSNSVAFTLTKSLNFGSAGNLSVDISRSATLFSNKYEPGNEAILDKQAGLNYNYYNDMFEAFAFGVNHFGYLTDIGLTDNLYFNYAGNGYQNPANSGYTGAKVKYGGNLKRSFYHNRYTVSVRADFRNMPLSYVSSDKWKNYQLQLDNRYQLSNRVSLDLKYTAAGTNKWEGGVNSNVYQSQNVEISANSNFKLGKLYTVSHLSIGNQTINDTYMSQMGSDLLMLNYAQSLVLHKSTITATLFYNRELGTTKLIGNMLNSDLSYQYTVLKILTLSSGLTYLNNTGVAKQAGIKQGVQIMSGKHFSVSTYLDLRRNLVVPLYPDLYASNRGEVEIKYFFKTN
jgi:hypothetical protein